MVNIYVGELNQTIFMGEIPEITTISYDDIIADAKAKIYVALDHFKYLFNFKAGLNDLDNLDEHSILQYKVNSDLFDVFENINFNPVAGRVYDGFAGNNTGHIANKEHMVAHDYIRQIAFDVFGDENADFLFQNRTELYDDLINVGQTAHDFIIRRLDVSSNRLDLGVGETDDTDTTPENICREVFRQLIRQAPERFVYHPNGDTIRVTDEFQGVPFRNGDTLRYKFTIYPANPRYASVAYRYPGPKPKTYEIVMELRDTVNEEGSEFINGPLLPLYDPSDSEYNGRNDYYYSITDEVGALKPTGGVDTKGSFKWAVNQYKQGNMDSGSLNAEQYGTIEEWKVGQIIDFGGVFSGFQFNDPELDLTGWDTSNVKTMASMFEGSNFNGNISTWGTAKVTDMSAMFKDSSFNGDISEWNTSSVQNMSEMFSITTDTGDTTRNFEPMTTFTQFSSDPIIQSEPEISNFMLLNEPQILSSSGLDTNYSMENIENTNFSTTIQRNITVARNPFNGDISNWKTGAVTNMSAMFKNSSFNGDISDWNVINVSDMSSMFENSEFSGNVSNWETDAVTDMRAMFKNSNFNGNVNDWDVKKVTTVASMFENTPFTGHLNKWRLNSIQNADINTIVDGLQDMFKESSNNFSASMLNITRRDLVNESEDISGVGTIEWSVKTISNDPSSFDEGTLNHLLFNKIEKWNVYRVTDMGSLFEGVSFEDPNLILNDWNVSNVTNMNSMFKDSNFNGTLGWNLKGIEKSEDIYESLDGMFEGTPKNYSTSGLTINKVGLLNKNDDISGNGTIEQAVQEYSENADNFAEGTLNELLYGKIEEWDVNGVTDMGSLFEGVSFEDPNLNLNGWNVNGVTNMNSMFKGSNFTGTLEGWDLTGIEESDNIYESLDGMFEGTTNDYSTSSLTINKIGLVNEDAEISGNGTIEKAVQEYSENADNFAEGTLNELLYGKIEEWDVSGVTDMDSLFEGVSFEDPNLNLNDWNVGNVTNMNSLFKGSNFTGTLEGWDLTGIEESDNIYESLDGMFEGTTNDYSKSGLIINNVGLVNENDDISGNGTIEKAVEEYSENADNFAQGTLNELLYGKIEEWDVSGVTDMDSLFKGVSFEDPNLNLNGWNVSNVTNMDNIFNGSNYTGSLEDWELDGILSGDNAEEKLANIFNGSQIDFSTSKLKINKKGLNDGEETDVGSIQWAVKNYSDDSTLFDIGKLYNAIYGTIEDWDVSGVTNMNSLFKNLDISNSNINLNNWNVEKVTDMTSMFEGSNFNGIVSEWKVHNVNNMASMFEDSSFNGDLSGWNVINVTDMASMFENSDFSGNVSSWDVDNVLDMTAMFKDTTFSGDVGDWDVSNVTDMRNMFKNSKFNGDLSEWNLNAIESSGDVYSRMTGMFDGTPTNYYDTSLNVTQLGLVNESEDISGVGTIEWAAGELDSNNSSFDVGTLNVLVYGTIDKWNVSGVTNMTDMFNGITFKDPSLNLNYWDVSGVTNMTSMFKGSNFSGNVSGWNVEQVTNMKSMFEGSNFSGDLSSWDLRAIDLSNNAYFLLEDMFTDSSSNFSLSNLSITQRGLINGDISEVGTIEWAANELKDISSFDVGTLNVFLYGTVEYWNVSGVTNMSGMFKDIYFKEPSLNLNSWTVDNVTNMASMFEGSNFSGNVSGWNLTKIDSSDNVYFLLEDMFTDSSNNFSSSGLNITQRGLVNESEDISGVGTIEWAAETLRTDISSSAFDVGTLNVLVYGTVDKWNVSGVTNMADMFNGITFKDPSLNLNDWDVSGVTNMSSMFEGSNFSGNVSSWNLTKIDSSDNVYFLLEDMFKDSSNNFSSSGLNITQRGLVNGDISEVGTIEWAGHQLKSDISSSAFDVGTLNVLVYGTVDKWNVSGVTNMADMFNGITFKDPSLNLNYWDVSGVTNMSSMFEGSNFSGDVSDWDVSGVTNMASMFKDTNFNGDVSGWNVINVTNMSSMFEGSNFSGIVSEWNVNNVINMSYMFEGSNFSGDLSSWELNAIEASDEVYTKMFGMLDNTPTNYYDTCLNVTQIGLVDGSVNDIGSMYWAAGELISNNSSFDVGTLNVLVYGTIENWDVSGVTNMSGMFKDVKFKDSSLNLNGWTVDNVTNMTSMFEGSNFSGNVSGWNLTKIDSSDNVYFLLEDMFKDSSNNFSSSGLNITQRGLVNGDISEVGTIEWAAETLRTDISGFDVGTLNVLVYGTVDKWNVDGVTNMADMFNGITFKDPSLNLNDWDVSGVTNMSSMFEGSNFSGNVSGWNVSGVTNMSSMFEGSNFSGNLSKWELNAIEASDEVYTKMFGMLDNTPTNYYDTSLNVTQLGLVNGDISEVGTIEWAAETLRTDISSSAFDVGTLNVLVYGTVDKWNVSGVTNMADMFNGITFKDPSLNLNDWDVSGVTNMSSMFEGSNFSGNVSDWDVSGVTNMSSMFKDTNFSGDLSSWDLDAIDSSDNVYFLLEDMFTDSSNNFSTSGLNIRQRGLVNGDISEVGTIEWAAETLSTDISGFDVGTLNVLVYGTVDKWNVGGVTNMADMFNGITFKDPSLNLNDWDVSGVTNMSSMFEGSNFSGNVSDWVVSGVTNMASMFKDTNFSGDLSGWNVINVTNMTSMFEGSNFSGDLSSWDLVAIDSSDNVYFLLEDMFKDTSNNFSSSGLNITQRGLVNGDISEVGTIEWAAETLRTNISSSAFDVGTLNVLVYGTVDKWNVDGVTNMADMFNGITFKDPSLNLNDWDVSGVTNMSSMFEGSNFSGDVSGWNVINVTNMSYMFEGSNFSGNLSSWELNAIEASDEVYTKMFGMLDNTPTNYYDTCLNVTQIGLVDGSVNEIGSMYWAANELKDISGFDVGTLNVLVYGTVENWDVSGVTNMSGMFKDIKFKDPSLNLNNWDVSGVTNMTSMFEGSNFSGNVSGWNLTKIDSSDNVYFLLEDMFKDTSNNFSSSGLNITQRGLVNGDISEVGTIEWAAETLRTDISGFDVGTLNVLVYGTVDKWNVSGVTNMDSMFNGITFKDPSLNLNDWDVSGVTNMSSMFEGSNFSGNVSDWDVSGVTNMSSMFEGSNFNGDVSGWNVINVTDMASMFEGTNFSGDLSSWDLVTIEASGDTYSRMIGMFDDTPTNYYDTCLNVTQLGLVNGDISDVGTIEWAANELNDISAFDVGTLNVLVYGTIDKWNVSGVTNMTDMFNGITFKDPSLNLNDWDVSGVTNMASMFEGSNFSGDLSSWDLDAIDSSDNVYFLLEDMFKDSSNNFSASGLNITQRGLVNGDISEVGTIEWAAETLRTDISGFDVGTLNVLVYGTVDKWNVSGVTNMSGMFNGITFKDPSLNLNDWDVSGVTNMSSMFEGSNFSGNVSDWDVSGVTNMASMFKDTNFSGDVSGWNVINVTDMASMFEGTNFSGDLSSWDLNAIDSSDNAYFLLEDMFKDSSNNFSSSGLNITQRGLVNGDISEVGTIEWAAETLRTDISGFDVGTLNVLVYGTVDKWNVSGVTNMADMFNGITFKDPSLNLNDWDVSGVTNMSSMFEGSNFSGNVSDWDVSGVTNMSSMFKDTNFSGDLSSWDLDAIDSSDNVYFLLEDMFKDSSNNFSTSGLNITQRGLVNASEDISGVGTIEWAGDQLKSDISSSAFDVGTLNVLVYGTVDKWNVSGVTNMSGMFEDVKFKDPSLNLKDWDVSGVTNMASMFEGSNFSGIVSDWDVSGVTNMASMFKDTNFSGDVSGWNVINVTNMASMFEGSNFSGDLSPWDLNAIDSSDNAYFLLEDMFKDSSNNFLLSGLNITQRGLVNESEDISGVGTIEWAGDQLKSDISSSAFDVGTLNAFLYGTLDEWNIENVTSIKGLFQGVTFKEPTISLNHWDVRNIEDMSSAFESNNFNGNIANWDVRNVTDMTTMFKNNTQFDKEIVHWDVSESTILTNMFEGATKMLETYTADGRNLYNESDNEFFSRLPATPTLSFFTGNNSKALGEFFNGSNMNYKTIEWAGDQLRYDPQRFTEGSYFASKYGTIENWNTSNVTTMRNVFKYLIFDVSSSTLEWDVTGVTNMNAMFKDVSFTNPYIDLSWNVSNVTDMRSLFMESNYDGDLSKWTLNDNVLLTDIFTDSSTNVTRSKIQLNYTEFINGTNVGDNYVEDDAIEQAVITLREDPNSYDENQPLGLEYGTIDIWNVSKVTNMEDLFSDNYNSVLKYVDGKGFVNVGEPFNFKNPTVKLEWDVTSVTNMKNMFKSSNFNGDLSSWDLSEIIHSSDPYSKLDGMFLDSSTNYYDSKLQYPQIDLSDGTVDTKGTFKWALDIFKNDQSAFNRGTLYALLYGEIGEWKFDGVTDLSGIFMDFEFDDPSLNLNGWDISGVTNLTNIFRGSNFNGDLSSWNTDNVSELQNIFTDSSTNFVNTGLTFKQRPLVNSDGDGTPEEGTIEWAVNLFNSDQTSFDEGQNFNILYGTIENWDVSLVTDMSGIFMNVQFNNSNIDFSNWNVQKVTNMTNMFKGSNFNGDLSSWEINAIRDLSTTETMYNALVGMFEDSSTNYYDSSLNTGITKVGLIDGDIDNFGSIHWAVDQFKQGEQNSFDVGTLNYLFFEDIENWDVTGVEDMSGIFMNVQFDNSNIDFSNWNVSGVTTMTNMFKGSNFNGKLSSWELNAIRDLSTTETMYNALVGMFEDSSTNFSDSSLNITQVGLTDGNSTKIGSIYWAVDQFKQEPRNRFDAGTLNYFLFKDIENWNVSSITNMSELFMSVIFNDDSLNLNNWDVSGVENMYEMFRSSNFNGDISEWNVHKVKNMGSMFYRNFDFNGDISEWDVRKVTNMRQMFYRNSKFNQDIRTWNPPSSTTFDGMFYNATAFQTAYKVGDTPDSSFFNGHNSLEPGEFVNWTNTYSRSIEWAIDQLRNDPTAFDADGVYSNYGTMNTWDVSLVTDVSGLFQDFSFSEDILEEDSSYLSDWDLTKAKENDPLLLNMFTGSNGDYNLLFADDYSTTKAPLNNSEAELQYNDISGLDYLSTAVQDLSDESFEQVMYLYKTNTNSFNSSVLNYKYGNINDWNVQNVTKFGGSFTPVAGQSFDITDISGLNLSKWKFGTDSNNVSFNAMFYNTTIPEDISISNWDTSKVVDMDSMFNGATFENPNIDLSWNVQNVTTMTNMFRDSNFNGDISGWIVTDVAKMNSMFMDSSFNGNIGLWDVSSATDMSGIFMNVQFENPNIDLSWNVQNVTTMTNMFKGSNFNGDLSSWEINEIRDLPTTETLYNALVGMFEDSSTNYYDSSLNTGITKLGLTDGTSTTFGSINWTVTQFKNNQNSFDVGTLNYLFFEDIENWDVSGVENMDSLFKEVTFIDNSLNLNNWDVSGVTNMSSMFNKSNFNGDISEWNVRKVSYMSNMFRINSYFNKDIRTWNPPSGTNFTRMFYGATAFLAEYGNKGANPDGTGTPDSSFFNGYNSLEPREFVNWTNTYSRSIEWAIDQLRNDPTAFDADGVYSNYGTMNTWDVSLVTDVSGLFQDFSFSEDILEEDSSYLSDWDLTKAKEKDPLLLNMFTGSNGDYNLLFDGEYSITKAPLYNSEAELPYNDISGLDYSSTVVQDLNDDSFERAMYLYRTNRNLYDSSVFSYIYGNINDWNVQSVTRFGGSFTPVTVAGQSFDITDISGLNLSKWKFGTDSNNVSFDAMFNNTTIPEDIGISNWDTSKVTDMDSMFNGATFENPNIDLSWNVENVVFMENMFKESNFNGDISDWIVTDVATMDSMFMDSSFNGNIGLWDVQNVTNMAYMFKGVQFDNSNIDLSWNVQNVEYINNMFENSTFSGDLINWDLSYIFTIAETESIVERVENMFNGSLTNYIDSNIRLPSQSLKNGDSTTEGTLKWAATQYMNDPASFDGYSVNTILYGPIERWDVRSVTDMQYLFQDYNFSNVETLDLSEWDISSVANIDYMFLGSNADFDILGFDPTKIALTNGDTTTEGTIEWAVNKLSIKNTSFDEGTFLSFNYNTLGEWDVSGVTNMDNLFEGITFSDPTIKLNWNVTNVTSIIEMFKNSDFAGDLSSWKLNAFETNYNSADSDTYYMVRSLNMFLGSGTNLFNSGLRFNSTPVTTLFLNNIINALFTYSAWPTYSNTAGQGYYSTELLSNVTYDTTFISPIKYYHVLQYGMFEDLNVSDITSMTSLFYNKNNTTNAEALSTMDLSRWNVSNVTSMSNMFRNYLNGEYNLHAMGISSWDVRKVTSFNNMFYGLQKFMTPLYMWDVSDNATVTDMFKSTNMTYFYVDGIHTYVEVDESYNVIGEFEYDVTLTDYGIINNVTNRLSQTPQKSYFIGLNSLPEGSFINGTVDDGRSIEWAIDQLRNNPTAFDEGTENETIYGTMDKWNVEYVLNVEYLFQDFSFSEDILDISYLGGWDLARAKNIDPYLMNMFTGSNGDYNLLGYDDYRTTKKALENSGSVTYTANMAYIDWDDARDLNDDSYENALGLFRYYPSFFRTPSLLKYKFGYINDWNITGVTNFNGSFGKTNLSYQTNPLEHLDISLSKWTFGENANCNFMFNSSVLPDRDIGISEWDMTNVISTDNMFYYATFPTNTTHYNLDWDLSNCSNLSRMFIGCTNVPDVSKLSFTTSTDISVNASEMFGYSTFNNRDLSLNYWNVERITNMNDMFTDSNFQGDISGWNVGDGTTFARMFRRNTNFQTKYSVGETPTIAFWNQAT